MTINSNHEGERIPVSAILTTTSPFTLFEGYKGSRAYCGGIRFCNVTAGSVTLDVYVDDNGTSKYAMKGVAVAANSYIDLKDIPIDVRENQSLMASCGTGNAIHVLGGMIDQRASGAVK